MIHFDIVTIFPDLIEKYCSTSIIDRARKHGTVSIKAHNLRDWTTDKHKVVDDRVFGGAPGMLLKVEPLHRAVSTLREVAQAQNRETKVIATVASGELFTQTKAQSIVTSMAEKTYIILCGHYEGFDARVFEFVDEQWSIGPYILTGGELPALIMVDAITRLIPGALGNEKSPEDETTFTFENGNILVAGEHPQFTMPAKFTFTDNSGAQQVREVPEVLRSGHHQKIKELNTSQKSKKTW